MKRAVILHGTDGTPEQNWFPWLKAKLEAAGYEVWVPELPGNHTPDREAYGDYLFGQGWDFTDNVIVGHSSGAVEVLNLLMDPRLPKIKLGVMVSAWATMDAPEEYRRHFVEAGMSIEQFTHLFPPEGFDFRLIKSKANKLAFLHGSDDPFCPPEQAKYLSEQLDAPLTIIPGGGHLGSNFKELPDLWSTIANNETI